MCGIVGLVARPGESPGVSPRELAAMRDVMAARGPDGAGEFHHRNVAFAHRRLAIRDLAGGEQPWRSGDGETVLVYNGEFYNDAELREELAGRGHRFRSRCDTEVVMEAWRAWGPECVSRFRGMFAFALYDFRDDSLFLARDRFGVKPLFVTTLDGCLAFASTVRALLTHPRVSKAPCWPSLSHYLTTFRLTLGRATVFEGIHQLLPGERLLWTRDGAVRIERYWDFPAPERETENAPGSEDDESSVEDIESLLRSAVRSQLASDVPVGMFLSGGVDSSVIATLVRDAEPRPMLGECGGGSTLGDEESSDFAFARRCARHAGFDYDEVRLDAEDYFDGWQRLLDEYATPVSTPTDVVIFRLASAMKKSVGVVLGGEGADELFCGYALPHGSGRDYELYRRLVEDRWTGTAASARLFRSSLARNYGRNRFDSEADHYFAGNSLIPSHAKPLLFQPDTWNAAGRDAEMRSWYAEALDTPGTPLQRRRALLHRVNLESLLSRLDSATMAAGLEARVPYTDHPLVEAGFRLPSRLLMDVAPNEPAPHLAAADLQNRGSLRSKRILRQVAERLLPLALAHRRKQSFPTPVATWLAGPWRERVRQRLRESPFGRAHFQPAALQEMAEAPERAGMWLWPLLNVLEWGDRTFASSRAA